MTRAIFKNLIQVLDNEINAYAELKKLFEEKKEVLKKAKPDDLGVLDNNILALNNAIVKFNKKRQEIAIELTGKDANMSALIEAAQGQDEYIIDALKDRKVKICKLIEDLTLLNNQNVELLNHGITISNKMLETIIDAFAPQGCNYNGAGKSDSQEYDLWTVNEEI